MLTDARSIDTGSTLSADVCIIGAGPAGISIAKELIGSGIRVVLLESGGLEFEKDLMKLTEGESVGRPYPPLFEARARAFGGSSHFWREGRSMRSRPLDPIDLEERPQIPFTGWPIGFDDLRSYYAKASRLSGLGEIDYSVESGNGDGSALPFATSDVHTTLFRFAPDTHVFPSYLSQLRAADNIELVHHACVVELTAEGGVVRRADVAGLWNTAFEVRADVFVLAAGGIENARLLLASRSEDPRGMGNTHDNIGRFFMEHLHVQSGVLIPEDPELLDELQLYELQNVNGRPMIGVLVASSEALRDRGILNNAAYLSPTSMEVASSTYRSLEVLAKAVVKRRVPKDERFTSHITNLLRHPIEAMQIGLRGVAGGEAYEEHAIQITIQGQQAPNPNSRVTLSERTDPLGFPLARLDWQLSEADTRSIRGFQELMKEAVEESDLGEVKELYGDTVPLPPIRGHWHHMGTTRMSSDPATGVVDRNCRMHAIENLYVAGSSLFPTGGFANPTLTVVAMALRLAEHLREKLAR